MDEGKVLAYVLPVAGALIGVIWLMLRQEARKVEQALDKKAPAADLAEAKTHNTQALKDIKEHFQRLIDQQRSDYQDRIRELNERQDREVDWLKDELSKLGDNLQHMRSEQSSAAAQQAAANAAIMQNIQGLSLLMRRSQE